MSTYLQNLVQRAAGARPTAEVGPIRTATPLVESPRRPAAMPAAQAAAPSTGNDIAAVTSGTDTAAPWSRFTAFVPAAPECNKLQPQHTVHNTVHVLTRPTPTETSQEIRSTTLPQLPGGTPRKGLPTVSPQVSSPSRPAPVPTRVSTERAAEHEMDTHETSVANTRPRFTNPPLPVDVAENKRSGTGGAETAASTISKTAPAEFVHPRRQSMNSASKTALSGMAQTTSIDASHRSEAKPVRVYSPVTFQRTKVVAPQPIVPAAAPALRLPPAGPADRSGQRAGEMPPGVQVRIGRVEVRAASVQETPPATVPASAGARGFDDYISLRAYTRDNY